MTDHDRVPLSDAEIEHMSAPVRARAAAVATATVGLTEDEAVRRVAAESELTIRVVEVDEPLTMDFSPNRVTAFLRHGIVVSADGAS